MSNRISGGGPIRITKRPSKDQLSGAAGRAGNREEEMPLPAMPLWRKLVDLNVARPGMHVEDHSPVAHLALNMVFGDGALNCHLVVYSQRSRRCPRVQIERSL